MLGAQQNTTTVDLLTISSIPIQDQIPEEALKQALQQTPFVTLPGALNLRDLGASAPSLVKRGLIFRSGTPSTLPPESLARLYTDLNIRRIFDLRSKREVNEDPTPNIQGIEKVWLPPARAPNFVDIALFAGNGGARGYSVLYMDYLTVFAPIYKALFEQLRDRPHEAILFHCNGMLISFVRPCLLLLKNITQAFFMFQSSRERPYWNTRGDDPDARRCSKGYYCLRLCAVADRDRAIPHAS
jgi:hypothetical protein